MRARHKKWTAPYLLEHPEVALLEVDAADPFFQKTPLYLEIGMGKGDFLIGLSKKQPGHYLGIEREEDVLAIALKKILSEGLEENIRLLRGDFDFLQEKIAHLRFEAIYLNFSDPWPKKRHWKRRLETKERLLRMKELLVPGGRIYFKSDDQDLYQFTLEQAEGEFLIESSTNDYALEENDVASEYEKNFRSLAKPITRIILKKE
ncbi:MAG: tRNA (guanosine(46)-N7)-methyltransferase TrmB [Bacilli bacterium]|nr:tRNA (guanosine(46)-N7)-methyltransferase TrmB [Bacilli bacterium]